MSQSSPNDVQKLLDKINNKLEYHSTKKNQPSSSNSTSEHRTAKLERIKEEITLSVISKLEPFKSELFSSISSTVSSEFAKFSKDFEEKQQKYLETQLKGLMPEPSSSEKIPLAEFKEMKETINNYEDNFEKIQDNCIKLNNDINQLESNQKVINEIVKIMKDSIDSFKSTFDSKISSLTEWQDGITQTVAKSLSALKNELDDKINDIQKQISHCDTMLNEHHIHMEKNVTSNSNRGNNKPMKNNMGNLIEKDNGQNNLMISKDTNKIVSENISMNDNDKDTNEISINIHPNGLVSNLVGDCVLESGVNMQEKFIISPALLKGEGNGNSGNVISRKSVKNTIGKGNKKGEESQLKRDKNWIYHIHSATEINGVDTEEFGNYLKKYVTPLKNYENVLEIDFDFPDDENGDHNEGDGDGEGQGDNDGEQPDEAYYLNAENDEFDVESL